MAHDVRSSRWLIAGKSVGWILFGLALPFLGAEIVASLEAGRVLMMPLGLVWYQIDPGSLNLAQAVIQRYLLPALWDPAIVTLLLWPGWAVLGLPGLLLLLVCRIGKGRRWLFWSGKPR